MSNESNYLASLIGKEVKINRGGPDTVLGKLLAVQSDYLILHCSDGAVYVQNSHVKSITENRENKSSTYDEAPRYYEGDSFHDVLENLKHRFVQINGGGPEKLEGFIVDVTSTHLLLVVKQEVIRVPIFHIRSICVKEKNKSQGSSSGGNRSGGNKSGQRSGHRSGNRSGSKSGHRSGQNVSHGSGHRSGQKSTRGSGHRRDDSRGSRVRSRVGSRVRSRVQRRQSGLRRKAW
ncbi:hypothetical protein [Paenibacillus sp. 32O-W]|uniref:hypothetical protein n=1 Tax=Paenibacillus sp. 32O-W TaxID=1695218 RepID=UPI0011A293FC|nr:hypothetical protein [Paenibacillus sp. 32O-W]